MIKKILVIPNSYKECADSVEISKIISEKLSEKSLFKIILKPLTDGGDGFLNVCKSIFKTEPLQLSIKNDLDGIEKEYTFQIDHLRKNVFIESAELFGLKLFDESQLNPLNQNSEVLGKIIAKLSDEVNCKKLDVKTILIGIGGTATIDFGIGACSQLGLSLFGKQMDQLLPAPQNFSMVTWLKFTKPELPFGLKCIVDVDTPLVGEPGAIEIYGHQKGATENDLKIIKSGIKNIFNLIANDENFVISEKLNGAGGGLAAGLNIFLDAEIIRAEDFIKNNILTDLNLNEIDAVITGEGSFDDQSFEGKGAGIILKIFAERNIPIFLLNGSTNLKTNIKLPENIFVVNLIDFFGSRKESIKKYRAGIAEAAQIVINNLSK